MFSVTLPSQCLRPCLHTHHEARGFLVEGQPLSFGVFPNAPPSFCPHALGTDSLYVSSLFAFLSLSVHESCIHMVLSGEPQGAAPSLSCLEPSQRDLGFSIPRPSGVDVLWEGLLYSLRTLVSPPPPDAVTCGHYGLFSSPCRER